MKVKFLKSHDVYKAGDTEELPEGLANYLIQCTVAELATEKKVIKPKLEKK